MKTRFKKIIAVSISAVMIVSSLSAFAENSDMSVSIDKYIDVDTDTKIELPDDTVLENTNDSITDNPSISEEVTEMESILAPEITDEVQLPDMTIWDNDTPLDWNEELTRPLEMYNLTQPAESQSGTCGNNISWDYDSATKNLSVYGTGKMTPNETRPTWQKLYDDVESVDIYSGITSICKNAFSGFRVLQSVSIPSTVTAIEEGAFSMCIKLTDANIPSDITKIPTKCFEECDLRNVEIPDGVTSIGAYAFKRNESLTSVIIPDNVTGIADGAFQGCTSLTSITIGKKVKSISQWTFRSCTGLKSIVIPSNVTSVDREIFDECESLETIYVNKPYGSLSKSNLSYGNSAKIIWGEMNISDVPDQYYTGNAVEPKISIKYNNREDAETALSEGTDYTLSYENNNAIGTGTIKINYLGDYSNYNNTEYSTVDFNIRALDVSGICGDNLTWRLVSDGTLTISGTGNMYDYSDGDDNRAPWYDYRDIIQVININNGATSIGNSAFNNCRALTDIKIADSIVSIGGDAFKYCTSLTEVTIPDGVERIGSFAFVFCFDLRNVEIPDSIKLIDWWAFQDCHSLSSIRIPNSAVMAGNVFRCDNLTDIIVDKAGTLSAAPWGAAKATVTYLREMNISPISNQTYTGTAITPKIAITEDRTDGSASRTLVEGNDYTVSYSDNITVGTATANISYIGNYSGYNGNAKNKVFLIDAVSLTNADITFPNDISYQGEACMPEPTVVVTGKTLAKDTDYTVSYSNNNCVGTATATITGKGNYTGSKTVQFEIMDFDPDKVNREPVDINDRTVEVIVNNIFTYDGIAHTPRPKLVYTFINETTGVEIPYDMQEGKDYEIIAYENNINAGTAKIIIKGINAFKSTREITFIISPCEVSDTEIADIPSAEYCKEYICPEPEIRIGDKILEKDVDYTLEYENNRNRGTASVIITGKGNISGTITKNFEITPRDGSRFTIIVWL